MCVWMPSEAKEVSDSLELELQTVVSHHVGAGNWEPGTKPRFTARATSALNHQALAPAPISLYC